MSEILKVQDLTKKFGKKKVLDGLTLSVESGRIVGLLAPNASGKTTLFRLIMGLLKEDSGEILIDGKRVGKETNAVISYNPDLFVFGSYFRIKDAIEYMKTMFPDFDEGKAKELFARQRFDEGRRISSLSKGEKEQVQLVLFLSRKAKLYLLDEPLAAVDPIKREFIINTILGSFGEESSVIISTQLVLDIEKILDDVVMIKDGKVCLSGEADVMREKYGKNINEIFKDTFRYAEGGEEK